MSVRFDWIISELEEVKDFLDELADVKDSKSGGVVPNDAMAASQKVERAIQQLKSQ